MDDLFDWKRGKQPDYSAVMVWRQRQIMAMLKDKRMIKGAYEFYAENPAEFIAHWCDTYDPRNAGTDVPTTLPLILFQRQREFIDFLHQCLLAEQGGLVEKCRDVGATWCACAFSVWLWLFWPGASIGWGSRKEDLVDRIGDPDSIFEKLRRLIRGLPAVLLPEGFSDRDHMAFMKIVNPQSDASITGEVGDNIGRGGRKLIYLKDESAHYEHADLIEAALTDNTRVQIDISSVHGIGNVFYNKRHAGLDWLPGMEMVSGRTHVFVFDWRDHPQKDQAWHDERKAKMASEGLLHIFYQEIERNYAASVEGLIIQPEWVQAAVDAHIKLRKLGWDWTDDGGWMAALDVADGGGDTNALTKRQGRVLKFAEEWGERDTGATARRAIQLVEANRPLLVQYDSIGVGAGVKAETNRIAVDEKKMPRGIHFVSWNAGGQVQRPESRVVPGDKQSPLNKDFFSNLKAQGWFHLGRCFEKTYDAITHGTKYPIDELISLDSRMPRLRQIEKELCQVTASKGAKLKMVVDKTPDGAKSPNIGDSVMMNYFPQPGPIIVSDKLMDAVRQRSVVSARNVYARSIGRSMQR